MTWQMYLNGHGVKTTLEGQVRVVM